MSEGCAAMKVSFKMNITMSSAPHNGLFVASGVRTGHLSAVAATNDADQLMHVCTSNGSKQFLNSALHQSDMARNAIERSSQTPLPSSLSFDQSQQEREYIPQESKCIQAGEKFACQSKQLDTPSMDSSAGVSLISSANKCDHTSTDVLSDSHNRYHINSAETAENFKTTTMTRDVPITVIASSLPPLPPVSQRQQFYELNEYEKEPYNITSAHGKYSNKIHQREENNFVEEPKITPSLPIKLNLFDHDLNTTSNLKENTAVQLYIPSHLSTNIDKYDENEICETDPTDCAATTTTTTTVEIFREKLNDSRHPVDYFRLPAPPLSDGTESSVDLVRAHGPRYEKAIRTKTYFEKNSKSCVKGSSPSKVRWEDVSSPCFNGLSSSQPFLNYTVQEPSSLSSATYGLSKDLSDDNREFAVNCDLTSHETNDCSFSPKSIRDNEQTAYGFRANSSMSDLHDRSTSFSSIWNLADGENELNDSEENDDSTSVATILRYQQRVDKSPQPPSGLKRRCLQPLAISHMSENDSTVYSRIKTPSPCVPVRRSGRAPPLPPKRYPMRRTNSQPSIITETERKAPPRPHTQKPTHLRHYSTNNATQSLPQNAFPWVELPVPKTRRNQLPTSPRSASSNEIFKLYQTRDCLGNVLYES